MGLCITAKMPYWRAGASQLNRTTGTNFLLLYHGRCHTANHLRVSKLTQLTIFHTSSPRVYRHGDSSRRCTVATVQDEANPSSSQPAASCCVASESTEAQTAGENTCSQKRASCLGNSRREREAFSSMLSAARSTREARYEQMCHLLSHQRRLEAETPAMRRGKHV